MDVHFNVRISIGQTNNENAKCTIDAMQFECTIHITKPSNAIANTDRQTIHSLSQFTQYDTIQMHLTIMAEKRKQCK